MRVAYAAFAAGMLMLAMAAQAAGIDWAKVDQGFGKPGTDQPGGVHKYALPRTDLHVSLDGVTLQPGFALGGWLAFAPMGDRATVMGDLVLTEQEINPVMAKLLADGITITALHNHLLRAQPATFYMHVAGTGDPVRLAAALHDGLSASGTPFGTASPAAAAAAAQPALDAGRLQQILGRKGSVNGDLVQFAFPRTEAVKDGGMTVPPAMGTATSINFQPTGDGKAAITGDFVLLAVEVNPVLQALRQNGIEVTAVHNHMLDDEPRMFFVHFWGHDDPVKLAEGLRTALDRVNLSRS